MRSASLQGKQFVENSRLFNGIQIVTGIAVVLGLALVAFELYQAREFTRLQMSQENVAIGMNEFTARYGENVGEAIAAACSGSTELTRAHAVVVDSVFNYQMWWIGRQKQRLDGGLGGSNTSWKDEALRRVEYIAGFPQGKRWLKTFKSRDAEVAAFVIDLSAKIKPKPCTQLFELFDAG